MERRWSVECGVVDSCGEERDVVVDMIKCPFRIVGCTWQHFIGFGVDKLK